MIHIKKGVLIMIDNDKLEELSNYLGNTIHVLEGLLEGLHEANDILEDGLAEIEALENE